MRTPATAPTWTLTRRGFLHALGLACVVRFRPIAARLTAITDDVVWLMRWCSFGSGLRFAGA